LAFLLAGQGIRSHAADLDPPKPAAALAETGTSRTESVEAAYRAAQQAALTRATPESLWQLGRAAFDHAELLGKPKAKALVAENGIKACRAAVRQSPSLTPAHYYLALCLGQLAQTKTLGALRLVREMEAEFETVHLLDERYDYAGADRGLGLLYLEAPGWLGLGDKRQARSRLERAVVLAPQYPENRLNLLELLVRSKDLRNAQSQLAEIERVWPGAKTEFTGQPWAAAWLDWDTRKAALTARLQKLRPGRDATPH